MSEALPETGKQRGDLPPLHRTLEVLATALAGLGGLVIFGAAVFVTISVVGYNLGLGALKGDFEIIELACASCASLFLPLCQLKKGHVLVDIFTSRLSHRTNRFLDSIWTLIFALCWALICWRLSHGMHEIRGYGDMTALLRAPIWWVYVPAVISTGFSAFIALVWGLSGLMPGLIRMEPAK